MKKNIIVSGIQPSGELHIGNYLGALRNFVKLQEENKYDCFFFIADLHSMTVEYDGAEKARQTLDLALDYLAAGIDPERSDIFVQSHVPACTELAWIFNTITPIAELERMTQFKDKTQKLSSINMGLLDYPVLMAADILLYRATAVPVGQDQFQHLELTRKIARFFNNRFGQTFEEPKEIITPTPKIMSLQDPAKKMSKSHGPKSYIAINDAPEVIEGKIKKAVSASAYDEDVYGFYATLLGEFGTPEHQEYFASQFKDKDLRFSELKAALAEDIAGYFRAFRERRTALQKDPERVREILRRGAERAEGIAQETMRMVRKKTGLL